MKIQQFTDKAAIGISFLCIVHCLVLPIAIVILPSISVLGLHEEYFHKWLLLAIIPISLFALTLGCRKHSRYHVFFWGGLGLILLLSATFIGHDLLGEQGERGLTLVGSLLVAYGHLRNYQHCKKKNCCENKDTEKSL